MLKKKPTTARTKRFLDERAPKLVENTKLAIFVKGQTANAFIQKVTNDLMTLKKPDARAFSKRNKILPFEDPSSVEFFADKNDASLFVVSTHSKKRPNNLILARTFDAQILDLLEIGVEEEAMFIQDFKGSKCNVGMRPLMLFSGQLFESHPSFRQLKSFFMDMFRGREIQSIDAVSLQHVIVISHGDQDDGILPKIHFRVYLIRAHKSGQKLPRVELDEMGPRFNFRVRRLQEPDEGMLKMSLKRPIKQIPKTKKNISTDEMGDQVAQIHLGKQDLSTLQTRKFKGLKRSRDVVDRDDDDDDATLVDQ